jgi:hypothetical protein
MTSEQQRFEEWYKNHGFLDVMFDKDEHDDYTSWLIRVIWEGWQAAQHGAVRKKPEQDQIQLDLELNNGA